MSRAKSVGTFVFVLVAVLLLLLFFVLPLMTSFLAKQHQVAPAWLSELNAFTAAFTRWFMTVFVVAWVFFLGSTFASFLNVVAWRVPKGRSILGSSHCPHCNIQLTFKDNIPIAGWLKNGGRCSSCNSLISVRYLIVELALGAIFLFIAGLVIMTAGESLPFHRTYWKPNWQSLILAPSSQLLQFVVFHWTMILVLFTFALIELEWLRIPLSVWTVGTIFGLLLIAIWPNTMVVGWHFPFFEPSDDGAISARIAFILLGLLSGVGLGWYLDRCRYVNSQPNSFAIGLTIVGLFLGWQSVLIVSCICSTLLLVSAKSRVSAQVWNNLLHSPHCNVLAGTLMHLATWSWLNRVEQVLNLN